MKGGLVKKSQQRGFTIMETMIVLVVTGALFLSVAGLISGKQASNEFLISSRDISTEIRQITSEVSNGYYPNRGDFNCMVDGSNKVKITAGSTAQGSNDDCIFLGKVLLFGDTSGGTGQGIKIFSVAGARMNGDDIVTSLDDAQPTLLYPSSPYAPTAPDESENYTIHYGLNAQGGGDTNFVNGGVTKPVGGIAILTPLNRSGDGPGYEVTPARQVEILPIVGTTVGQDYTSFVRAANCYLRQDTGGCGASVPARITNPDGGVHICYSSNGANQSVLLTIGGSNPSSVTMDIKNGVHCA